jgi:hypothetical protein
MLLVLFLVILSIAAYASATWRVANTVSNEDGHPPKTSSDTGSASSSTPAPETLEGALVAQLASREITQRQYVRAMEGLAARDVARHPLGMPPEG